jgi:hypothetical protein
MAERAKSTLVLVVASVLGWRLIGRRVGSIVRMADRLQVEQPRQRRGLAFRRDVERHRKQRGRHPDEHEQQQQWDTDDPHAGPAGSKQGRRTLQVGSLQAHEAMTTNGSSTPPIMLGQLRPCCHDREPFGASIGRRWRDCGLLAPVASDNIALIRT